MDNKVVYVLCTQAGGVDVFFTGVNDSKPNFTDDIHESMFMSEKEAIKLQEVLTNKTNLTYEVIQVTIERGEAE